MLLRGRIHHTRWELERVSQELLQTQLSVSARSTQHDWGMVDISTMVLACLTFLSATAKQKQKFEHLHTDTPPTDKTDTRKAVINLKDRELEPAAVSILRKGFNFIHTTDSRANVKETISSIKQAILHIPKDNAEEI
jgi:hypothetical protein